MNSPVILPVNVPVPSLTDSSKETLTAYADTLVSAYIEEGKDILTLMAEAAKLEILAIRIKEKAKESAMTEICTYGKGGVTRLGVVMSIKEVGVRYDYSLDPVWQTLNQAVVDASDKRKAQEELLKKLPYEGRIMVDELTGEEYRAYPPAKSGGDGVILSIK